ncbi:MAG: hypothetical protein VKM98_08585, partial [Cyanobacteriota bacterium]|nr:hypothetical protein [Cyanobacteriota bacterium]
EQQQQQLVQQQEVLAAQRDLAALEREEAQLRSHKSQFDALQQQASAIKLQLQELPLVTPEQVRQLRQAEQRLAQAQARCEGMATRLLLLRADQPVQLDGQPLEVGGEQLLEEPRQLQVGNGTTIAISPGGGAAMGDARGQRQQAEAQLTALQHQLGLSDSEAADARAQQRLAWETELANLRTTAQAIPWARLDAQLAELEPRRQRLLAALRHLQAQALPAAELAALDASQDSLKADTTRLSQALAELERRRIQLQQQREQLEPQLAQCQAEAARLDGGLAAAAQQLDQLQAQHGDGTQLVAALQQCSAELETYQQRLAALQQCNLQQDSSSPPGQGPSADTQLQQLEAEKDTLLSRRGQQEQLCRSLGSLDPVAAVEQAQASWEQAQAERQRLEQRTAALQRLLEAFQGAQQQAADQYCLPLQTALQGYLDALQLPSAMAAQMGYDPQQGFGDLQLQQGNQSFDFEQLSGGMREQLAAALRLALAEVLLGAYDGCLPLVFDDAFSNSDPDRRGGVQRMLQRGVSRGLQIVMLSCTPDDFAALAASPGRRLQLGATQSSQP